MLNLGNPKGFLTFAHAMHFKAGHAQVRLSFYIKGSESANRVEGLFHTPFRIKAKRDCWTGGFPYQTLRERHLRG